jgi:acetyltransferase-like isoleucine patch superfamily enzyme
MTARLGPLLRVLGAGPRRYSRLAYIMGAALPGRCRRNGPVAWVRGFPIPDLRAGRGCIDLGHVGLYPGVRVHCTDRGHIRIADETFLNREARVFSGHDVHIGRRCMISWQAIITDCTTMGPRPQYAPVILEDEVWIGSRAIVLGGTHLEQGCVVAAGSVVQGHFAAGSVIAGQAAGGIQ